MSKQETFDGETPCTECGVVICGFCQGVGDPQCHGQHAAKCSKREGAK